MSDLIVAVGLVLVLEGLIWALSPEQGRRVAAMVSSTSDATLRRAGWIAITAGAVIVWLIRG
jgi:uncharacterized protein YjeT (DUF2065 family)